MQIIRDSNYISNLDGILDFIAKDSYNKAVDFLNKLDHKINSIPAMPYKSRQSLYYQNDDIRDLIFKGYTISYLIDSDKNQIVVLDIFKWINK